jgi:hypothetical protein
MGPRHHVTHIPGLPPGLRRASPSPDPAMSRQRRDPIETDGTLLTPHSLGVPVDSDEGTLLTPVPAGQLSTAALTYPRDSTDAELGLY